MHRIIAAALGGALLLWLSGPLSGAWGAETHQVIIQNYIFNPPKLTVKAGDSVTFINKDNEAHTATEDAQGGFDSGHLDTNASTITFEEPGVYPYTCRYHFTMEGIIEVTP